MACSCGSSSCTSCLDVATITIPSGADGTDGTNGVYGGYSSSWLFNTSTASGPEDTYLRADNADLSAATNLYISITNADSADLSSFLDSFTNSDNFGLIRIFTRLDATSFVLGEVTSVTDYTTDYTIGFTYVDGSVTTFTADDELVVTFANSGADGADGTGTEGATTFFLEVDTSTIPSGTVAPYAALSIPIPADTLATDGDMVEVEYYLDIEYTIADAEYMYIGIGDEGYASDTNELVANWFINGAQATYIKCRFMRDSSTSVRYMATYGYGFASSGVNEVVPTTESRGTMNNITSTIDWTEDNNIEIGLQSGTANVTTTITTAVAKYIPYQAI